MWGCGILKVVHLDFTMITSWNGQVAGLSWNMEFSIGTGQLIDTLFIATSQSPMMDRSLPDSAGPDTGSVGVVPWTQEKFQLLKTVYMLTSFVTIIARKESPVYPCSFVDHFQENNYPKAKTRPKWTKLAQPNQLNPIKSNQAQPYQSKEIGSNQIKSGVWALDKHQIWF